MSFIKNNTTTTAKLKANGSIDTNTYMPFNSSDTVDGYNLSETLYNGSNVAFYIYYKYIRIGGIVIGASILARMTENACPDSNYCNKYKIGLDSKYWPDGPVCLWTQYRHLEDKNYGKAVYIDNTGYLYAYGTRGNEISDNYLFQSSQFYIGGDYLITPVIS